MHHTNDTIDRAIILVVWFKFRSSQFRGTPRTRESNYE